MAADGKYAYVRLMAECSVCTHEYDSTPNREPRVLRCGHTFCTECLEKMCSHIVSQDGARSALSCPFCMRETPVPFLDVTRVPVNYSVLDLSTNSKTTSLSNQCNNTQSLCEYCGENEATLICFNCSLMGVRFCSSCDREEHERSFKPAQLHRRVPIDQLEPVMSCPTHEDSPVTVFSELHDRFACPQCQQQSDWSPLSTSFLPIPVVASKLRKTAANMNCLCAKELNKVYVASGEVDEALNTLKSSSSLARQEIKQEFAALRRLLAEREKALLTILGDEYETKKDRLLQQRQQLVEHARQLGYCNEEIRTLLQSDDISFLKVYRSLTEQTHHFLATERSHILSLVAPANIPLFFSGNLKSEISSYGIMGGGPEPLNLTCQQPGRSSESSLLQLSWTLPDRAPAVTQYEIEYESVNEPVVCSPGHSGEVALVRRPQRLIKSGKAQAVIVNDLYPNQRYRFRVRSSSLAGWGVWCDCVIGHFTPFPLRIPFTGEKVSFRIPDDGIYRIEAAGARAANGKRWKGGRGAVVTATVWLQRHSRVEVVVGGMSECDMIRGHSGGGGGTFVVVCENDTLPSLENLLIAAGGGGGTRGVDDADRDGCDASLETYGSDGVGEDCGRGGQNGGPGSDADSPWHGAQCWGYGGSGFLRGMAEPGRAKSYRDGSEGGHCGGFGGGGGVGQGGGGGGGYSGGGGGRGGGGGGTYVKETAVLMEKKVGNSGHGYVVISREPESSTDHMSVSSPGNLSRRSSISPVDSPKLRHHNGLH